MTTHSKEFWTPDFNITHRPDGTIFMSQKDPLPDYLPTIAAYLDKWADATPDAIWLGRRNDAGDWVTITYAQAREQACALGSWLLDIGLGPERPLVILSENSLEHGLLGLACVYVGIPYAPVSPAYSLVSKDYAKLTHIIKLLEPGCVFADDGAAFADAIKATVHSDCKILNVRNLTDDAFEFNDILATDPQNAKAARANITAETVAKYLFTSGSTGSPKAVINTNGMICAMQAMVRDCYRYIQNEPPVVLDWAPWNHTAAGNKVFYLVLTNGGSYYIDNGRPVSGKFDETLRNLRDIACTWYFNVPVGWNLLVEELEKDATLAETFFSKLGMMFYAGAGMAQHTWDRLSAVARKTTGQDVLLSTSLGSTETAPFALACTDVQKNSGNVGVPARGLTLKLIPTDGKLELRLKGPSITPGYYKDPEKTAEVFDDDGFYCMGDALRPADPDDLTKGFFFDGRIAENFKLNTGTWVAVGAVRSNLVDAMGGLIRDAVIVGENQAELGALLWLSDAGKSMERTVVETQLQKYLTAAADTSTGSASRVKRATILMHDPSFDCGEITEKGSLNQRALRANNDGLIAELYQGKGLVILA